MIKRLYARAFQMQQSEQDPATGRTLVQRHHHRLVVQNPPQRPMTTAELDRIYDLPYERRAHPMYDAQGGVPALAEVRFSINSHRGCYGSCAFCAIAYHQGRIIQNRSADSIVREGTLLTGLDGFKGYIHDVGGPTANFYETSLRQASWWRCLPRTSLPVAEAVSAPALRPRRLSWHPAAPANPAEGQKGLCALRRPLRRCRPRPGPGFPRGALPVSHQWTS